MYKNLIKAFKNDKKSILLLINRNFVPSMRF